MTDTADRVIERWADMFDEMMGLDDEAVDMVRQLLGSGHFGLREAVEWLEDKDSDEFWPEDQVELALAALKGEVGKQRDIEARRTLKPEEQTS